MSFYKKIIDEIKFDDSGLIVAIAQDCDSNIVLMQAYMNKQAIEKTLETGYIHYWSRSRAKLWRKGESSNQTQALKEFMLDCDGDSILLKVAQNGVACHTGTKSCYYRSVDIGAKPTIFIENQKPQISPEELYGQ